MSQQLPDALALPEVSDGALEDQSRLISERLAAERDREAEKCALNLVWANRYDVEIRRIRAEIKRQKYLLKLMNSENEKRSAFSSSYVSLIQYEQQLQESCDLEFVFEAERARSAEPALLKGTHGSTESDSLTNTFPSMDSGVFLSCESREGVSDLSVLDQLEGLMSQPCDEITESAELVLYEECLFPSCQSRTEFTRNSFCDSARETRSCSVSDAGSIDTTLGESSDTLASTSVIKENPLRRRFLEEKTNRLRELDQVDLNVAKSEDEKDVSRERLQGSDACKSPTLSRDQFGWFCDSETESERSFSKQATSCDGDLEGISSEDKYASFAEESAHQSCSLGRYFVVKSSCEGNENGKFSALEERNESVYTEESNFDTSVCDENMFAVSFVEGLKHRRSFCIENLFELFKDEENGIEGECAEKKSTVSPSTPAEYWQSCSEDYDAENDFQALLDDNLDLSFTNLEGRAQCLQDKFDDITLLSQESRIDFVGLDNKVSDLLRSIRDAHRQSQIVSALESLCETLEHRLEEEWWAAYDLHITPSNINYIV